jgi:ATP phosphoribosyltransferase regulatory subunit
METTMNISDNLLSEDEKAIFALRSLYRQHGFQQYRMNKFEEYDLYAGNKDYLMSEGVITFTDTNGKLMALKPDVTLSIIKNCRDQQDGMEKVYYNENVYRVSKRTRTFREIMQVGLECIGSVDDYAVYEVLMLAAQSLAAVSPDYVLDISELDVVGGVIGALGLDEEDEKAVLKCLGEKNLHGVAEICRDKNVDAQALNALGRMISSSGDPAGTIAELKNMPGAEKYSGALSRLERIISLLDEPALAGHIRVDFSVINDMNYYNGIVFSGFVDGIPSGILSGGQYDRLMHKMGRRSEAIGFAVYLDSLEYLRAANDGGDDIDIVLVYEEGADMQRLRDTREQLRDEGKRVLVTRYLPEGVRYKQMYHLKKSGVVTLD